MIFWLSEEVNRTFHNFDAFNSYHTFHSFTSYHCAFWWVPDLRTHAVDISIHMVLIYLLYLHLWTDMIFQSFSNDFALATSHHCTVSAIVSSLYYLFWFQPSSQSYWLVYVGSACLSTSIHSILDLGLTPIYKQFQREILNWKHCHLSRIKQKILNEWWFLSVLVPVSAMVIE